MSEISDEMQQKIDASTMIRVLGRIVDAMSAYLAGRWTAQGIFPDAPTALRFLRQFDPRYEQARRPRLRDLLRLRRVGASA